MGSENDLEFESAATLMPAENTKVDEIHALMGNDNVSVAEMKTSMHSRSPGQPHNSGKFASVGGIGGIDTSSVLPAESNYGMHQFSQRDEDMSVLGAILGNSPDIHGKNRYKGGSSLRPDDEMHSLTLKAGSGGGKKTLDEYEDLLNTIEQEHEIRSSRAKPDNGSAMVIGRINSIHGQANHHKQSDATMAQDNQFTSSRLRESGRNLDENIDFELEQEVINLGGMTVEKSRQDEVVVDKKLLNKNLNESSDFDLDNY